MARHGSRRWPARQSRKEREALAGNGPAARFFVDHGPDKLSNIAAGQAFFELGCAGVARFARRWERALPEDAT
eukprot:7593761-Pyramimonas_sp.AAC.1